MVVDKMIVGKNEPRYSSSPIKIEAKPFDYGNFIKTAERVKKILERKELDERIDRKKDTPDR